jgi:hypothetical protein
MKNHDALEKGQASISRSGDGTFRVQDLELAGIKNYAVVLADKETLRLAVRAPRDNERLDSVAVGIVRKGAAKVDAGRRRIRLARGIKHLDLTPEAVAGRFDLLAKDDLLILPLIGTDGSEAKPAGAKLGAAARPRFEGE